jgi:hypothetical protein
MNLSPASPNESALVAIPWPVSLYAATGLAGGAIFEGVE